MFIQRSLNKRADIHPPTHPSSGHKQLLTSREARSLLSVSQALVQPTGALNSLGMDTTTPWAAPGSAPEPHLSVLRPRRLLKMCQTPSVTAPPQHPSAAHAARAQLLPAKEQHGGRAGCETLQHSTLRGLIVSPVRLDGRTSTVLGGGCCFGAATQCRPPTGGLDTSSIWFSESSQPLHSYLLTNSEGCRDCHPQSLPLGGAVGSHVAQWGLQPPPRSCLSRQELCLCLFTLPLGTEPLLGK